VKVHPAAGSPRISGGFLSRTQREPFQPPIEPSGRFFSVSFAILYVPVFRRRAKWIPLGFSRVFPAPKPASLYLFGLRICRPDRLLDRGGEAPLGRCSSEGVPQGDCISEAPRLRRRTRSMTPSRHSQIRGIQKKRYNKEIFAPDTGPVSFSHDSGKNPG
jgi:hypothetical protein